VADRTQEITFGDTGAKLFMYPPDWQDGVPSAASCIVLLGVVRDVDPPDFTPVVTVDPTSIQVSAASGVSKTNRQRLFLATIAGLVVRRRYRLVNPNGQSEIVRPGALDATPFADLTDPMAFDYPASAQSLLQGLLMTAPVDAAWVANEQKLYLGDQAPFRVIWTYTIAGTVRKHYTNLRLVRQARRHNVQPPDLQTFYPGIKLDEPAANRGQTLADVIDEAYEQVRVDVRTVTLRRYRLDQIRDPEMVDQLVLAKALYLSSSWATPNGWTRLEWRSDCLSAYDRLLSRLLGGGGAMFIDDGITGMATGTTQGSVWVRR
jgi:hypothetical protein